MSGTWYQVDNVAKLFIATNNRRDPRVFRVCCTLDADIDPGCLAEALRLTARQFPNFQVTLHRGLFWHYMESTGKLPAPLPETLPPCAPVYGPDLQNELLYRVSYYGPRINVEMFHALSDGLGALEFFKAVLYLYAVRCGRSPEGTAGIIDLAAAPSEEEAEDAFYRYHRRVRLGDVQLKELMGSRPALIEGTLSEDGYAVSYGGVSVDGVRAAAKSMGASVTAFMCGAIARAVHNTQSRPSRDIVLMVPVNLREMFPSRTLRNFVNFVRLTFRHGECTTLADFVSSAAKQLKEKATPDEMAKFMSTTVSTERSLPLRLAPLWLKILAARIVRFFIKSRQTLIFSNLGRVSLPEGTGVRRIVFNLNVSKTSRVNIGALSLGDEMTVAFTRSVRERTLEDELFAVLEGAGVTAVCRGDSVGQPDINGTLAHNTSL